MIADPERRGRELAALYADVAPRLFADLEEAGLVDATAGGAARARREWDCFALYACVRGLVAAGGFNRETAGAIDALHQAVLSGWKPDDHGGESADERRALISARYAEYGEIGQAGGKSGAATVARRLGDAAARRMTDSQAPPPAMGEMVGSLHESLAEGAAEAVRRGEAG